MASDFQLTRVEDDEGVEVVSESGLAQRRPDGTFAPGNQVGVGHGRPRGSRDKLTIIRDAVMKSFGTLGQDQYLQDLASIHPPSYVALVAKVLAAELKVDEFSEDGLPTIQIRDYTKGGGKPEGEE